MRLVCGHKYNTHSILLCLEMFVETSKSMSVNMNSVKELAEYNRENDIENTQNPIGLSSCHSCDDLVSSKKNLVSCFLPFSFKSINLLHDMRVLKNISVGSNLPNHYMNTTSHNDISNQITDPAERSMVKEPSDWSENSRQ